MVERFGRTEWAKLPNLQDRAMKVDETQRLFREIGVSLVELYCMVIDGQASLPMVPVRVPADILRENPMEDIVSILDPIFGIPIS